MIYLAHFSFEDTQGKKGHGHFTCVVEAGNAQGAQDKIRSLLTRLQRRHRLFGTPAAVYLDDLIEIHEFPAEGFLAHMITSEGPLKNAESHSLPGVDPSFCRSFSVVATDRERDTAEISPFQTFENEQEAAP